MLWWLVAAQAAGSCENVDLSDLMAVEAPAVVVLGERHGRSPDMARARKVVYRWAAHGPLTLALESVDGSYQPLLDRFAEGELDVRDLPHLMAWDTSWGFRWKPYEPLVSAALVGAHVVAAGLPLGPKPDDAAIPIPPGYATLLSEAFGGHEMPASAEGRFVAAMAYRDHQIARQAIDGWDGRGLLVIVAGRGHVEGSKGIGWQVARMTDAPVHAFVLARGPKPPCYPGDRLWK